MLNNPVELIATLFLLALLPLFVVVGTSFLKISISLSLLRSALGIQQVLPNMVIYGLALILTAYTMAPVVTHISNAFTEKKIQLDDKDFFNKVKATVIVPYTNFLRHNTSSKQIDFFAAVGDKIWHDPAARLPNKDSLVVLIPAFTVGQLIEAFKVGLLINLPFLAIDLIVSNLLLAMGMIMVSPVLISMPFKLLVFILINGWDLLIKQLLLSYQ